jgi:hypothetical protein
MYGSDRLLDVDTAGDLKRSVPTIATAWRRK